VLTIQRHATAEEFLAHAGEFLSVSEAEDNVVLGVALASAGSKPTPGPACYWASVRDGTEVAGCAIRTPPYQLYLTRMPGPSVEALTKDVFDFYGELSAVGGPAQLADQFAQRWSQRTGKAWSVRFRMRIHKVTKVTFPRDVPRGDLRRVRASEFELVLRWSGAFIDDTGIVENPGVLAERLMSSDNLFFWDDGGPRCMVAATRDLPNGVCVNAVYTPPPNRARGYASAAVATMSEDFLRRGKAYCCLYTDVDNPTSNSIYTRIGYHPIREDVSIDFVGA
jgi:predicted GNAT family acetyltransferase